MAIPNYAEKIRSEMSRHGHPPGGLVCLREIAGDKHGRMVATAELGKLGIKLKDIEAIDNQKECRAELRRAINSITDHVKARPENLTDETLEAVEHLTAEIEIIDYQEKLDRTTEEVMGARAGRAGDTDLRDHAGNKIGVLLSNADLQDAGKIATKLGKQPRAFGKDQDADGNLTEFFRGAAGGRTTGAIRDSLTEGTDSEGGHAVPSWLLPGILQALVPASSMLSAGANIGVLQQPGDSFKIAAVNSVPTAAWRSESGTLAESDPTFRAVTIIPRSLAFIFKVSRELLMDAPGIEVALRVAIAQAFAKEIDRAGLVGTGTAPEIRGIANTTGVSTFDMGTDGAALANYSPIIKARRLLADANAPIPNAIICSTREAEAIDLFADTTGQPLRRPPALESMNFVSTSQVPVDETHGTATDAATMFLGNFPLATFYMREALSVRVLAEKYAGTGEIGFACHARVDMALAYPAAFCLIKGVIPA